MPTHCIASCTDCTKVNMCKGGAEEVYPLEASRTLTGVAAHIEVTDGAGVPGARMVTDGARNWMGIATNKEQSQDKKMSKGVRPAEKQSETMGATFWSSPLGDLSFHFNPSPLGRGLHHHDEVAGRWCRFAMPCRTDRSEQQFAYTPEGPDCALHQSVQAYFYPLHVVKYLHHSKIGALSGQH